MSSFDFLQAKEEILERWGRAVIRVNGVDGANRCADKIIASKGIYKQIEFATGVPWWFVGCIHSMESNFDFSTWLANGDDVTKPTVRVPKGLVCNGTWPDGAIVSLRHEGYHNEKDWSLAHALWLAECYNGLGYRGKGKPSQYVWSFTNIEEAGRYVADGVWGPDAWSAQIGVVAMLKKLVEKGAVSFEEKPVVIETPFKITWYEMNNKADGKPVLIGYDGEHAKFIADINNSETLADLFKIYGIHNILVAPANKPIPFIPGSGRGPGPVVSTGDNADKFFNFYKNNYDKVRARVEEWFAGVYSPTATENGCVAHTVSALELSGLNFPAHNTAAAINVGAFLTWALANGWTKVTSIGAMRPGDVCTSGPTANLADLDHVYTFVDYFGPRAAHVLHNQAWGVSERNLTGGPVGEWKFAVRMPG
jgi:lysozyme family protein